MDSLTSEDVAPFRELVSVDEDGSIVTANPAAERLLGYEPGSLVGRDVEDLVGHDVQLDTTVETVEGDTSALVGTAEALEVDTVAEPPPQSAPRTIPLVHANGHTVPVTAVVEATERDGQRLRTIRLHSYDEAGTPVQDTDEPVLEYAFDGGVPVVTAVNDAFREIFAPGDESASLVDHPVPEVLVPGGDTEQRTRIEQVLEWSREECTVRSPTETGTRTFRLRAFPSVREDRTGGFALPIELTELSAREVADRLTKLVETTSDAVVVVDIDRDTIVECNPRACELFGYGRTELHELSPTELLAEGTNEYDAFVEEVLSSGEAWRDEFVYRARDGVRVPAETVGSRVERDGRGQLLLVVHDLRTGEAAPEAPTLRPVVVETGTGGLAIVDRDGLVVYADESHAERYGFGTPEALVGLPWQQLYDGSEHHRLETEVVPKLAETGEWTGTVRCRRPDGSTFQSELRLRQLDAAGLVYVGRALSAKWTSLDRLEAMQQLSSDLMVVDSATEIAERAVDAVAAAFDFHVACIRLFDPTRNALDVAAATDEAERLAENSPAFDLDASRAGQAFRREEQVRGTVDEADLPSEWHGGLILHLPLNGYGTLTVFRRSPTIDELTLRHIDLLAATVSTALESNENEATVRQHERELEAQYADLDTLNRINTVLDDLIQRLIESNTRSEVYHAVCEGLVASEFYESAWVGTAETVDGVVELLASAGLDEDHRRMLETLPVSYVAQGAVADAIETGELRVVRQYHVRDDDGSTATDGTDGTDGTDTETGTDVSTTPATEAVAAVPLRHSDRLYGVLVVNTTREDVFGETGRDQLQRLGETVGFVINAVLNRELLLSDSVLELEFRTADPACIPVAFSAPLECRARLEMVTNTTEEEALLYLRVEGADPEEALALAETIPNVTECDVVSEYEDGFLLEISVRSLAILELMQVGASVPTIIAEDGVGRIIVETSLNANIREIAEMLRGQFPDAELTRKRELDHPVRTAAEFRDALKDQLTDKQLLALETAHVVGFYEWPRSNTAKDLAASLGISAPTLHQHLRKAEQKLVEAFFEGTHQHPG